jgi:hypothetical protein
MGSTSAADPQEKMSDTAWDYISTCSCEVPEHMTVYFKDERVNKVVFSGFDG